MQSTLFAEENLEVSSSGLFTKQNSKMLKADLANGDVLARQGTMVANQGDANFEHEGAGLNKGGLKKMLKKAVTGEGLTLMRVSGAGEVFFGQMAADIHVIDLENDRLSINGMNILGFTDTLEWDIEFIKGAGIIAGGLFNTTLTGTGQVAVITEGKPVVLETAQAPTYVDPDAAVCWSAGLSISVQTSMSMKSLIGRGSGESAQLAFTGQGMVVVQPAENMRFGGEQQGSNSGQQQQGVNLGSLLGG